MACIAFVLQVWLTWLRFWYSHVGLAGMSIIMLQQLMCLLVVAVGFGVAGTMAGQLVWLLV